MSSPVCAGALAVGSRRRREGKPTNKVSICMANAIVELIPPLDCAGVRPSTETVDSMCPVPMETSELPGAEGAEGAEERRAAQRAYRDHTRATTKGSGSAYAEASPEGFEWIEAYRYHQRGSG
jgi:hypothetical protein